MQCFDQDWCYIVVDAETGFASVRCPVSGLEYWEADL